MDEPYLLNMYVELQPGAINNPSQLRAGYLKLPYGSSTTLFAFGEDGTHVHCITGEGTYYGIFKSDDPDHIYQLILKLKKQERPQ